MRITSLSITLRLHVSGSLKDKRLVVKSVKQRLRNKFNVAVAEVGELESWRTARLGVVTVGGQQAQVDREIDAITRFLDSDVRFEMVEREVEHH